jgi:hypothetical protein
LLLEEDAVYHAKWTAQTYTITFHANGGRFGLDGENQPITIQSVTVPYLAVINVPAPAPSHQVLALGGWNSQADGKGTALVSGTTQVGGDADYYAVWTVPEGEGLNYAPENSSEPWLGASVTMTIPEDGWYKIELWGAQGGPAGTGQASDYTYTTGTISPGGITSENIGLSVADGKYSLQGVEYSVKGDMPPQNPAGIMSGGRGAYTSGHILLNEGDVLTINIGGSRVDHDANSSGGGFNGGGSGQAGGDGSGGGATDVRFNGIDLRHRIMAAGGGGGSSDARLSREPSGSGPGLLFKAGYATVFGVGDIQPGGGNGCGSDYGKGAKKNEGGMSSSSSQAGIWGYGGNAGGAANESYGAGGGGWFGGGAGGQGQANGSGGGGNCYISGAPGFIACSEDSTGNAVPSGPNYRIGDFRPRHAPEAEVTDDVRAASWTGKVFTNYVARAGNQEMPKPGQAGGTEIGHEGPGAARIAFIGNADEADARLFLLE